VLGEWQHRLVVKTCRASCIRFETNIVLSLMRIMQIIAHLLNAYRSFENIAQQPNVWSIYCSSRHEIFYNCTEALKKHPKHVPEIVTSTQTMKKLRKGQRERQTLRGNSKNSIWNRAKGNGQERKTVSEEKLMSFRKSKTEGKEVSNCQRNKSINRFVIQSQTRIQSFTFSLATWTASMMPQS